MSQITSFKPRSDRPLVVITDFDFDNKYLFNLSKAKFAIGYKLKVKKGKQ